MLNYDNNLPVVLLPLFTGERCVAFARELLSRGMPVLAVCNPEETKSAEEESARALGCAVTWAVDREQAIRRGFEWFLAEQVEAPGIVLTDMECGYSPDDVLAVARAVADNPGKLVVASRGKNPAYRGIGTLEAHAAYLAFAALHNRRIRDPWSGLKGIPAEHIKAFLHMDGSGRRYEFNLLLSLQQRGIPVVNAPVTAPYRREPGANRGSRLYDLASILMLPMKFISASLVALLTDYAVFTVLPIFVFPGKWGIATAAGRFAGAAAGYLLNRSIVFRHRGVGWKNELGSMWKFALLAFINFCLAFAMMYPLIDVLGMQRFLAKMIADALLYVASFIIQRDVVFKRRATTDS